MLNKLLIRIKSILLRRRPLFRYSWRYLLPCEGYIAVHRQVMLRSLKHRPWLICVFAWSLLTWFLCWHWVVMYRAMRRFRQQAVDAGVPIWQQVTGLLAAGLGQGISGFDYYHFKLYRVAPTHWWRYVFDFQLPHFHHAFQTHPISQASRSYLSCKGIFAERLAAVGGHPVATIANVNLQEHWPIEDWLVMAPKIFIKPEGASRSQGCVTISKPEQWRFEYAEAIYEGAQGLESLKYRLPMGEYLVQPLLEHHPTMAKWQLSDKTITLRIVSAMDEGVFTLVAANLELNDDTHRRFKVFAVDLVNGTAVLDAEHCAVLGWECHEAKVSLPHWTDVLAEIELAHRLCADVHTVGWDAVITPNGVVLLEGNLNWGINTLQIVREAPLLPLLCQSSPVFLKSMS
ncbi:sugar-transfer associated ATP-grasp domain-containing protein [Shewanella sp. CG12_big_fil_rev_8_21_14_0_65_47_15]|uniref:sugar-transfer associated ATP-grasp domain-containing protein n=1 Tax=Shewanella sp. CG12_big_fil_rev_8_21_14_0_65_47_15 TaxID=1975537 RepID=UPI000CC05CE7|nr:sugar-transfer associated ATP-grasp domain-containing protein [Shewanella sp. CG12_big_fil_rev_8_21_14_0_65_47_15]PIW59867.1 MAG: hypothetical protein COW15_15775 [Shewanella sp. CG12_big_fil_rev_8_21_14_0_65_47_15]